MDSNIFTCELYKNIRMNRPNFVIMNFTQVDNMQRLLAKKHCPGQDPVHHNSKRRDNMVVKLSSDESEHSLNDWIDAKINILQWTLNLNSNRQCKGETRSMEEAMLQCETGFIQVSYPRRSL